MAKIDAVSGALDSKFPEADVDAELNPGKDKNFEVDPISSQVATSLEIKERVEAEEEKKKEEEKKESLRKLKTTVMISGMIVALAGAVFAIAKKLREK